MSRQNTRQEEEMLGEQYRFLFDHNPEPMWVYDLETLRFLSVNHSALATYGYSRDEFLNMTITQIRPPEEIPSLLADLTKTAGETRSHSGPWRHLKKDGSLLNVEITSLPMEYLGRAARFVLALDVTGRVRAEQEREAILLREKEARARVEAANAALSKLNAALQRANIDLEQFAYSASHDLQEPIRTVVIYTDLLKDQFGGKLNGQADEFINRAAGAARRIEMLVKDLLAYAQAADGCDASEADANTVLGTTLANLEMIIAENRAAVTQDRLPIVKVGPLHLQQIFQNLVSNALKYRGNSPPRIHVSARQKHEMWRFSIADNGIGIDARYHKQIFGLFKRLHGCEEYTGTGIGLAICQKVVARYGGSIWVESEPGKGSTFHFTLPGEANEDYSAG
ncbi:MAG TPA: ATP-binding protein [Bryobacteraceae bacterium]